MDDYFYDFIIVRFYAASRFELDFGHIKEGQKYVEINKCIFSLEAKRICQGQDSQHGFKISSWE